MKKVLIYAAVVALLVSSCGTYQGSGAYVGAQFGSILGSAIGGISNGHRGSNVGTIVGMVGGAVVGSAIGAAADQKDKQEVRDRYHKMMERKEQELRYVPTIEIRNAHVVDQDQNRVISRGEVCKVIFEIYNHGHKPLFDLQPTVVEATGNKQIYISPNMHVERLDPGQGIRYTAMLKAGSRLKNGMARICVSVLQGNKAISEVCEFNVPTRK